MVYTINSVLRLTNRGYGKCKLSKIIQNKSQINVKIEIFINFHFARYLFSSLSHNSQLYFPAV